MLTIDIPTIVFEILNFLALTALLYYLLFRPILRGVNARAEARQQAEEDIARQLTEAQALRAHLEERLAAVDHQISVMVAEAQDHMEETRRSTLESARHEAERILKEAASEARQLQQKAVGDQMDQLLSGIRDVSAELIRQTSPAETHDALVTELNERIWNLGSKEMVQVETIRRSFDKRFPTVVAETALDLKPRQVQELMRTLSALIDHEVELDVRTDPDLIFGLRVRVGDTVINNSVAAKLDKIMEDAGALLQEKLNHV
ncbi:MAG: F0F1 ATP synthase subunit delta [Anaerolineales bacterium]|nr:F0F1 ATP synthase subunit delta [Anaerolineales bacterium]